MTFLEACIQDSLPIWESCLDTKFLKGIADGTLPEECFKGYIVDDSLYLREYAKVFAPLMASANFLALTGPASSPSYSAGIALDGNTSILAPSLTVKVLKL